MSPPSPPEFNVLPALMWASHCFLQLNQLLPLETMGRSIFSTRDHCISKHRNTEELTDPAAYVVVQTGFPSPPTDIKSTPDSNTTLRAVFHQNQINQI